MEIYYRYFGVLSFRTDSDPSEVPHDKVTHLYVIQGVGSINRGQAVIRKMPKEARTQQVRGEWLCVLTLLFYWKETCFEKTNLIYFFEMNSLVRTK